MADHVKDFAQGIDELKKLGASLTEAVSELNKPQYRAHATEDTAAYWEPSRQKVFVQDGGANYQQLKRGLPPGYKNDVWKTPGEFLRDGFKNGRTAEFAAKHASLFKTVQGMSEQVGADGGYLVLPEFNNQIIDRVYNNDLFARTDGYTVSGNSMTFTRNAETSRANGSRHGGMRGYWVGEGGTITDSKPTVKQITLRLNKLAVLVYLTEELIQDAGPALEQYVTRKASEEFNFMLGDAVFNGIGVGQPLGINNSPALLSVAKENGQAAATIVSENIDKMYMRRLSLGGAYQWYKHQDTEAQLAQLTQAVGTGGDLLYRPPGGLSAAPYSTLKGLPVTDTEFNATLGTQGDIVLADLGQMISITKGGISQEASIHVEFLTDQLALRFIMRVDARPWEDTPVTPYKGSTTQSSFVVLDTRS